MCDNVVRLCHDLIQKKSKHKFCASSSLASGVSEVFNFLGVFDNGSDLINDFAKIIHHKSGFHPKANIESPVKNRNNNPKINILMSENVIQKRLKILEYFDA